MQQFEPFFDDTHGFAFDQRVGVSSTLLYDPLERVVATLHPDHTLGEGGVRPVAAGQPGTSTTPC